MQEPQEVGGWSLSWEDPLEESMATHSSILAWRISQTEEPGQLQSMGSQRVGHDWATDLIWSEETRVWSLGWEDPLEESMATHSSILAWRIPLDRGAWRAAVHGVTESDMTEQLSTTTRWRSKAKISFHSRLQFRIQNFSFKIWVVHVLRFCQKLTYYFKLE